jgi:hypothetical protein
MSREAADAVAKAMKSVEGARRNATGHGWDETGGWDARKLARLCHGGTP